MEKSYGPLPSIVEENNPRDLALCGLKQWVFLFELVTESFDLKDFRRSRGPSEKRKTAIFMGGGG